MNYEKEPLHISTSVPNGTYEVTVTVTAHEDIVFTILSQSRRFMAQDINLGKGESTDITFNVSVCDYHKNNEDYTNVNGVEIDIMCDGDFTALSAVSPVNIPTVYIAGDSTVTDQPAEYPYNATSTYCGWGQMFPQFFNTGIAVENHAQSGSTTEDFKNVNFTAFKDKIKKGDFLIIEFGHNDQKIDTLDAFGGYTENLKYFVNFVREKGANPIICSPINRIIFQEDGTLLNLLGDYRTAVKNVCDEMNVPFIDLWSRTTEFFEAAGAVKAWDYFWGNGTDRDYTHTNDFGAYRMAGFVAGALGRAVGLPVADTPAWTPAPPFAPLAPPKDCALPAPDTDPFADYDATRPQEVLTRAEALELAIKALKLFPINVYNDLYADIVGHETYAGTVQCAAQNDLIPAAWIADGRLYPQRTVTAADFLAVLMPGAAGRRPLAAPSPLPDSVPAYARFAAGQAVAEQLISADSLNDPITRSDAAALCRRLHI